MFKFQGYQTCKVYLVDFVWNTDLVFLGFFLFWPLIDGYVYHLALMQRIFIKDSGMLLNYISEFSVKTKLPCKMYNDRTK